MFNINFTPEQIEEIKKAMQEETGMMTPMPEPGPTPVAPNVPVADEPGMLPTPMDDQGNAAPVGPDIPVVGEPVSIDTPMDDQGNAAPIGPDIPTAAANAQENTGLFSTPEPTTPDLTPQTPTPKQMTPYEERIQGLMEERGWDREKAEENQRYAISQGYDLNGDGVVTDQEFGSGYTSAANTDIDQYYAANGQGLGSVYISSEGRTDAQNMGGAQRFEILQRANDKLLGEGQEWGFEEGATGQWGTYGGPGFSLEQNKIDRIDFNRSGAGGGNVLVGGQIMSELYRDAVWEKAEVSQAQLGQVIDTPMGQYMVVNGMDGQLALKGLKGSRHGGGNYFFSMVDEGYHMGIHPETGEVWFQQAPNVVDLANRVREAGGDFITAMTSGVNSGDLGVWTPERVERFMQYGSTGISRQMGGSYRGRQNNPVFTDLDWQNYGGTFMDAYKKKRDEQANKPSVMSLFKEMEDYNG